MAKIRIPDQYIDGIEELRTLGEEDFSVLVSILESLPRGIGHKAFIQKIATSIPIENSKILAEAIFSFGGLMTMDEIEAKEELPQSISLAFSKKQGNKLSDDQIKILESRIDQILRSSSNIKLTYEAYNIMGASQSVIINTNILTDVRMILDKESSLSTTNGLIFFNLKLTIQERGEVRTDIFSLDEDDLVNLKSQIDNILVEQETIKSKYKEFINFIDITE